MSVIGIVCEYNPFHRGHEYHIARSRAIYGGEADIVCVMSGDFVQRGEAAIFSKYARAEAACRCGANLVLELPLPWALSSAEGFARGAVSILGAVEADMLSFGSESGELAVLERLAECASREGFNDKVKALMAENASISYAAARQRALEAELGEKAALLREPNNILGVEYLKAIRALGVNIRPLTVPRRGAAHDGFGVESEFRSAAELRAMLSRGEDAARFIPEAAREIFNEEARQGRVLSPERLDAALVSRLRMFPPEYFASLRDAGDGAGERLYRAVRREATVSGIAKAAATKRYPEARMRRLCMCAALGVGRDMADGEPPYARVLAFDARGRALLAALRGKTELPIITKPAEARKLGGKIYSVFASGASAHDLCALAYRGEKARGCGEDYRTGPKIV